ncbi:MAG TPA: formimidoylglutamate deiminase [Steroidobacteraceae bacterium]|nr:formimidoylglutamate deiminase [Steroidobacteraceae bacterium]
MPRLWFESALLGSGWAHDVRLTVEGGAIARVEPGVRPGAGDERHAVGLPGLPNVHSHGFQRAMAGLTEIAGPQADDFWSWREVMYRLVERIGPDDIEAITAFAYLEMLEAGFTRVAEFHYLHHDFDGKPYANVAETSERIVAAAREAGIGLVLLPVLYAHANFGGSHPLPAQRRFVNDLERFARLLEASRRMVLGLEGAMVGIAAHSLRAVTPEELAAIEPVGAGPFHIHIAEQTKEVEDCLAWSGRRPIDWLLDHAPVDERWCLVHATHATPEELERSARSGAVVGLCPITEANLGDGVFPGDLFARAGGAYGIGSDSNVLLDAAAELRALEYSQRLTRRKRNVLSGATSRSTGRELFEAAVRGGGRALGCTAPLIGAGADADLVSLDTRHASLVSRRTDALLDSWIFAARGGVIDCVWRRGRKVVSGGVHLARDAVAARYRRTLERVLA